jgi:hypothetical protein
VSLPSNLNEIDGTAIKSAHGPALSLGTDRSPGSGMDPKAARAAFSKSGRAITTSAKGPHISGQIATSSKKKANSLSRKKVAEGHRTLSRQNSHEDDDVHRTRALIRQDSGDVEAQHTLPRKVSSSSSRPGAHPLMREISGATSFASQATATLSPSLLPSTRALRRAPRGRAPPGSRMRVHHTELYHVCRHLPIPEKVAELEVCGGGGADKGTDEDEDEDEEEWVHVAQNAYGVFIHMAMTSGTWTALRQSGPMVVASVIIQVGAPHCGGRLGQLQLQLRLRRQRVRDEHVSSIAGGILVGALGLAAGRRGGLGSCRRLLSDPGEPADLLGDGLPLPHARQRLGHASSDGPMSHHKRAASRQCRK